MVVQLQQYSIQFYWTLNSIPSIHYYPTVLPGNPYTLLPPGEYYPHGLREVQGILAGISRYRCVYRATTLSYSLYCTTYTLLYPYIPTSPGGSPPSTNQGRYGCISRSRVGRDSIEGQSLAGMHVIQYPHPLLLTIPYQGTPTSLFPRVVLLVQVGQYIGVQLGIVGSIFPGCNHKVILQPYTGYLHYYQLLLPTLPY